LDDPGCKEAATNAAEALLKLGKPKRAYFELDHAQMFGPLKGPVDARVVVLANQAREAIVSKMTRAPGQASVMVSLESQTSKRFQLRQVTFVLDLHLLPADPTPALPSAAVRTVKVAALPAGEHEVSVLADYVTAWPLRPGYFFRVRTDLAFSVVAGASGEVHVRVSERAPAVSSVEALVSTVESGGSGLSERKPFD
jgi:hypothetical protein